MPSFDVSPAGTTAALRVRAADAPGAVRCALGLPADADVALGAPETGSGWQSATSGGLEVGRVRPQNRMRFRRD